MTDWIARALELGAHAAKIIPADQVVVADWVRLKCQYGCDGFGERLTCPPFSPTPETTRNLLKDYSSGLLLHLKGDTGEEDEESLRRRFHEMIAALEREIFLAGYYRAFGMTSGPCPLCEECDLEAACEHPDQARPSMEACGVDVFTTVRQAGWEIEVVRNPYDQHRLFGLVLIQ